MNQVLRAQSPGKIKTNLKEFDESSAKGIEPGEDTTIKLKKTFQRTGKYQEDPLISGI